MKKESKRVATSINQVIKPGTAKPRAPAPVELEAVSALSDDSPELGRALFAEGVMEGSPKPGPVRVPTVLKTSDSASVTGW